MEWVEHMEALLNDILQRHWEWQEDWRRDWVNGALQVPDKILGQLGRADGLRRGHTFRVIKDIAMPGGSRARGGGILGGDEGREEVSLLR